MAQTNTVPGVIHRDIFVEAEPDTVFSFLTDAEKMVRWMGVSATLEPREGGLFLVDVTNGSIAKGEYREVLPNYRLSYTFGWDGDDTGVPPGSSLVEIDLEEKNPGTMLKLAHSGLPEPAIPPHAEGWEHHLRRLAEVAAGRDPGPNPMVKQD